MTQSFTEAGPNADMGENQEDREALLRDIAEVTERRLQAEDQAYWAGYFATQAVME